MPERILKQTIFGCLKYLQSEIPTAKAFVHMKSKCRVHVCRN